MYLCIENYSERGSKRTTTGFINKPLNLEFRGLLHFNQNCARAIMHQLKYRSCKESMQR
jgi:hypothetical protein